MPPSRRTPTAAESLMRWLAAWLVVAVCAQALTIGTAALLGAHRHGSAPQVVAKPMLWSSHVVDRVHNDPAAAHALAHEADAPHQHAADDVSVLPLGAEATAAALAAFVAAPAPRAIAALAVAPAGLQHVRSAGALWAPTAHTVSPPRHPPRV